MFKKLCWLASALALASLLLGSYSRLREAGFGCDDWPVCYGQLGKSADIAAGGADGVEVWTARAADAARGLLLLTAALLSPAVRFSRDPVLGGGARRGWGVAVAGLAVAAAQNGFFWWPAVWKNMPLAQTAQIGLDWLAVWVFVWLAWRGLRPRRLPAPVGPQVWALAAMLVLGLQMWLGAWVSVDFASLACGEFPRCAGAWLPAADFAGWLGSLGAADASVIPDAVKVAAHWLHRIGAALVFVVCTGLMLRATDEENPKPMRAAGVILSGLLLVQIGLGIFAVKHVLPFWAVLLHHAWAAVLMTPVLAIYFYGRYALAGAVEAEPVAEPPLGAEPAAAPEPVEPVESLEPAEANLMSRLKAQLSRTRGSMRAVLANLQFGQDRGVKELLDEVEASLIMADVGMETTTRIIEQLTAGLSQEQLRDGAALTGELKQLLRAMLLPCSQPLRIPAERDGPFVILVVGVNGAGKTTTIGKMAHRLKGQGYSVMLAAGDTFRAAAVEQLQTWGERNQVPVVAQATGADSASVIFDALQSARAKEVDVLIADTAGRLHTKSNLMDELKKIKRIIGKLDASAPHEVLLVLDAGTGQNALSQARLFNEAVNLTGIALTKLDGTAKGGVIFGLANQLQLPIRFIGVGESAADLQDFDAETFVEALFDAD